MSELKKRFYLKKTQIPEEEKLPFITNCRLTSGFSRTAMIMFFINLEKKNRIDLPVASVIMELIHKFLHKPCICCEKLKPGSSFNRILFMLKENFGFYYNCDIEYPICFNCIPAVIKFIFLMNCKPFITRRDYMYHIQFIISTIYFARKEPFISVTYIDPYIMYDDDLAVTSLEFSHIFLKMLRETPFEYQIHA